VSETACLEKGFQLDLLLVVGSLDINYRVVEAIAPHTCSTCQHAGLFGKGCRCEVGIHANTGRNTLLVCHNFCLNHRCLLGAVEPCLHTLTTFSLKLTLLFPGGISSM